MKVRLGLAVVLVATLMAPVLPRATAAAARDCEWLAGDFHVHTLYSHDVWGGPGREDTNTDPMEKPPESFADIITLGWLPAEQAALAASRELDFMEITDHDDVRAQLDGGWGSNGITWIPSYENTVSGAGHAQMHGATKEDSYYGTNAEEIAAKLRSEGGLFQINHPSDGGWTNPDGSLKFPALMPDALELWNIGVWLYHPPFPSTNDHEYPLGLYNDLLDQGGQVAATGGSDSHWRSTSAVQGIGQPTTWVCASGRSPQAILDGVKQSRTTLSHQPPAYSGTFAYLEADSDGDGNYEAMLGDTVAPGSSVRAVVENAPGATLRLVTNGGAVMAESRISGTPFSATFTVPPDSTWVRAEVFYPDGLDARQQLKPLCDASEQLIRPDKRDEENLYCENRLAVVALTSPIYFQAADFDPTTTLVYDGDTSAKVGSVATFAATLSGTDGPISGATITFTYRGDTYSAVTDGAGRATTQVKVVGPPGTYDVVSSFAGSDIYSASSDTDPFTATAGP